MFVYRTCPFFCRQKISKLDYMWRDIQRQAPKYAMAISSIPAAHPLKEFAIANLVGVIVNREGRYLEYFITTYKYWLLEGLEAGFARKFGKFSCRYK